MTGAPDPDDLLRRLTRGTDCLTHVERVPARPGAPVPWPAWASPALVEAFVARGVTMPWTHQAQAASTAFDGRHVVVSTGTGSGKSLAYQLPVLTTLTSDARATALYLAPTKALAADQLRALAELGPRDARPAGYDGDTPAEEREWVRANSRFILTNPDMLHRGILPRHAMWSTFLRRLRYVVIDECHVYRGVFGSHVAQVIRRLRRICARYGSEPVFVLASATVGDPATTAHRLTGLPVEAVTDDGSPRGGMTFGLWEPPLVPVMVDGLESPVRVSALRQTADLLTDAIVNGARTLAFIRSRRGAEVVAAMARRSLTESVPELAHRVAAYRAGYLREERRALEKALLTGDLLGLASTNALELGVDLVGLDVVVLAGYPGTLSSLWQQAGRAGRAGRDALCVLVARDDPLDTYLVHHPEALFGRPVEAAVLDPSNPYVLAPHLCCAAAELPLSPVDLDLFGPTARSTVDALTAAGALRRRPTGWYWAQDGRPDVDLRGTGGAPISIIEGSTGRLLGTVDAGAAHGQVHTGAVHLHQGVSYVVDQLDLDDRAALVHADEPDWSTHARDITSLTVESVTKYVDAGPIGLFLGTVDVTNQVVSYQRRRIATGEVIDTRPLDLPPRQLRTTAVWWTISPGALDVAGVEPADIPGALHAAEHAAIGLLPLVATCDRWDIGGLSTANHPDTDAPTIFVYDGHQGGAGFSERAYHVASDWLSATRTAIASCGCERGCPSCVQSPKCGNGNEPLSKADAVRVLDSVLTALAAASSATPAIQAAVSPMTDPLLADGSVRLRPWSLDDAHWYAETVTTDASIQRFTSESATVSPADVSAAIVALASDPNAASFLICDAATGERLGNVALLLDDGAGDVSYFLAAPARGRGVATRALGLFSAWAFQSLAVDELRLWTHSDNAASRAVAERVGYLRDPDRDQTRQVKGMAWQTVAYRRSR